MVVRCLQIEIPNLTTHKWESLVCKLSIRQVSGGEGGVEVERRFETASKQLCRSFCHAHHAHQI